MRYLIDGVEMCLTFSIDRGKRHWVGLWREGGKTKTKYLGLDDGSSEFDLRLHYKQLTKEPHARHGTQWIVYEEQRMVLHLESKTFIKGGITYGPYFYWRGHWYEGDKKRWKHFGKTLPSDCEIIEGDASDTK
jgi:hypothetical protein